MQSVKLWRWLALVSVVANVVFNYAYASDGTMTVVTDTYATIFRPAGYAFSIWGLIYLSQIVYAIYTLLPSQRNNVLYERQAIMLAISSVLGIIWLIAFTSYYIGASELIIIAMLVLAVAMFRYALHIVRNSSGNKWLVLVPFSLYAAWLSVATIANTFIWIRAMEWAGSRQEEALWGIALVVIAGIIGLAVGLRDRNPFYPLVVAWAAFALWAQQRANSPEFGTASLIVGIASLLAGIYEFTQRWPRRKMVL